MAAQSIRQRKPARGRSGPAKAPTRAGGVAGPSPGSPGGGAGLCPLVDGPCPITGFLYQVEGLRSLGQLAGGIAHDLNNLLMVIQGQAEIGLQSASLSEVLECLGTIREQATDAAQVVRRVQSFYRPLAPDAFGPVQLNQVVQAAAAQVEAALLVLRPQMSQSLQVKLHLAPLPMLWGSQEELRQLFTNLMLNAVDAMPTGGTISIVTLHEGGSITACVKDTGEGMSPEVQQRLFEPFFTTKGEQGTGLGLTIARWVLQRHGGEIKVESRPGQGTCVILRLPVLPSLPSSAEARGAEGSAAPLDVVLIDDEPQVMRTLAGLLSRLGHRVTTALSGTEGMELLLRGGGDLALVDLGMRDVDGWDILEAARERRPGLPVYLLTGYGVTLDPEEARRLGAAGILTKPVSSAALASVLTAHTSRGERVA